MSVAIMRRLKMSKLAAATRELRAMSTQTPLVSACVNEKTGVAIVTMQRPPVCGINLELASELLKTFKDLEANKCRGAILTSAMPSIFSAGLDILEMYKPDVTRMKSFWSTLQDLWLALYGSSYPTAAAINGHSPAGGCLLAISCEYRVMVHQEGKPYTIGLNETQLGIVAPQWFIDSYHNTLPRRIAESALTTGKLFTVDEALKVGLIDDIAKDKEEAVAKAEVWISGFSRIPPAARTLTKRALRGEALNRLSKQKEADLEHFVAFATSEKVQKSLAVYLEALKKKN